MKPSLKLEFRSLRAANNETTELLFCVDLTNHVKDLTMTNKLKRNKSYYQSKYINNKNSKDYAKLTQDSLFLVKRGGTSRKSLGRPEQATGNVISSIRSKFKTCSSKFL